MKIKKIERTKFLNKRPYKEEVNLIELGSCVYGSGQIILTTECGKRLLVQDSRKIDEVYKEVHREIFKDVIFKNEDYDIQSEKIDSKYYDGLITSIIDISLR